MATPFRSSVFIKKIRLAINNILLVSTCAASLFSDVIIYITYIIKAQKKQPAPTESPPPFPIIHWCCPVTV